MSDIEEKIVQKFAPPALGTMSQEEEEAIAGKREPKDRGGRLPKFYRAEVEEIRSSFAKNSVLAERYGVSVETIKRVREVGRYRNTPYIPRDEADRRYVTDTVPDLNGVIGGARKYKPGKTNGNKGRPFKSGRSQLLPHERKAVAESIMSLRETAEAYGVSVSLVKMLRREYGTTTNRTGPLAHRLVRDIHKDKRPLDEVAREVHLPVQVVRAIREGTFTQKLLADN